MKITNKTINDRRDQQKERVVVKQEESSGQDSLPAAGPSAFGNGNGATNAAASLNNGYEGNYKGVSHRENSDARHVAHHLSRNQTLGGRATKAAGQKGRARSRGAVAVAKI